ncbi:hypothetical protein [Planctobacterium marinum]|uniref:hypothetical protein n=1 Tax=Planctobacterium marinum TaxID=1631968 RepID=UPI001E3BFB47|nr:hypothetical protein [Planctobacterium marinum]MCC2604647.1 hypothetical protein [Planctobacterium marinum]
MKNRFNWQGMALCFALAFIQVSSSMAAGELDYAPANEAVVQKQLYHSGGHFSGAELCPASAFDTITPIASLHTVTAEQALPMTVTGVAEFIERHDISSVTGLLAHLPRHYRTHFSLLEHTRATGQANLEFPRIVLFGTDGQFLMNVGTKPDDPTYHLLDVAQLHSETGHWEFSVFDFSGSKPTLKRNDPSCQECHGSSNARPVWGSFLEWPGVFGDSIIDGPRPEAMHHTHAEKINRLIQGDSNSERFSFLVWRPESMRRGGVRFIAEHDFGPELLVSNLAMGSATAKGAFRRLTQHQETAYRQARKALLLSYYQFRDAHPLRFSKVNRVEGLHDWLQQRRQLVAELLPASPQSIAPLDLQLATLGLNTQEAFSLATLHNKEQPAPLWQTASSDLYDLLMLQVLDDLRRVDPEIMEILQQVEPFYGVFQCPETVQNLAQLIDFKMLHLFQLQGEARYQVHRVYFPKDVDDVYQQVFLPVADKLIPLLQEATGHPQQQVAGLN